MKKNPFSIAMLLLASLLLTGCSTWSHDFSGQNGREVWMAMTAVAESPAYDLMEPSRQWLVDENRVWVDEIDSRIEIFRRVHRLEGPVITDQRRIERTWRIQIYFHDGELPWATFAVRGQGIPVQGQRESELYFAEVEELLRGDEALSGGGAPNDLPAMEPVPASPPASQPETPPTTQPETPEVDLDDLESDGK